MRDLVLSRLSTGDDVEIVERKGAGHPDTICDALAETLSCNLCRDYQSRFGQVLHHNVDKALLCGRPGRARVRRRRRDGTDQNIPGRPRGRYD